LKDPITVFDTLKDSYISYVKTAFGTQFPGLEAERERLLRQEGALCQEPWIEPVPRYRLSGKKVADLGSEDLPGFDGDTIAAFKELADPCLMRGRELYTHQLEMLRKAVTGQSCVITAGTGSGKTEAFLLPLLAYLCHESQSWPEPDPPSPGQHDWWHSDQEGLAFVPQRTGEKRPAAIRALVLYPMNALVEDQMTRLRWALDSSEARQWFNKHRRGNRFYFGRYNSATKIPGHLRKPPGRNGEQAIDTDKIRELAGALREIEGAAEAASRHARETGEREVQYFFPRVDGAEMRSRWDMQYHPPDILITNFSMLSIMLMREVDAPIFEKTREWLAMDGSVFHLVIDELHLYRGTAGSEVAYLLRLLLYRLGIEPGSPKLRVLASSASLEPGDPASLKFLNEFFAMQWTEDQVIRGYPASTPGAPPATPLPPAPFIKVADRLGSGQLDDRDVVGILLKDPGVASIAQGLGSLDQILEARGVELGNRLLHACSDGDRLRATPISRVARVLFGNTLPSEDARKALQGVLAARALCRSSDSLPSFRVHMFFRNLEGLWACTHPGCGVMPGEDGDGRTAGQLFIEPRILCANTSNPHRVLELLYCEVCGTTFFGGIRVRVPTESGGGWELLPTEQDIDGIPDRQVSRLLERRAYSEFGVFWPKGMRGLHEDAETFRQPLFTDGASHGQQDSSLRARWQLASLDPVSGKVQPGPEQGWVEGYLFCLEQEELGDCVPAMPAVCPCCGADYRQRKIRKSPVRGFRTGFSKITQLLSKELFYSIEGVGARKLVVFSDSREEAAELANGIERSHYLDLVREAMYDEMYHLAVGEPALLADLESHGEARSRDASEYLKASPEASVRLSRSLDLVREAAKATESLGENLRRVVEQELANVQRQ